MTHPGRRTDQEVLDAILSVARQDPRIRATYLGGSRVDPAATQDRYSDFDVVYLVSDLPAMLHDDRWLTALGEPLIVQRPDDWFTHPYDPAGRAPFAFLMHFRDGHRIDLTLVELSRIDEVLNDPEPRRVLLDKDDLTELKDVPAGRFGRVQPPGERAFADTCNEFWWISLGVAKGLARDEVLTAKALLERYQLDMLLRVLGWHAGLRVGFPLAVGKFSRYLPRHLEAGEAARLIDVLCASSLAGQWNQLLRMCALFDETAVAVAAGLQLPYDRQQGQDIVVELERMRLEAAGPQP